MPDISKLVSVVGVETILDSADRSIFDSAWIGYCLACGTEHDSVEPDAEEYECENCGEHQVYGIENILMYL